MNKTAHTHLQKSDQISVQVYIHGPCVCMYVFVCEYYRLMTVDNANEVEGVSSW